MKQLQTLIGVFLDTCIWVLRLHREQRFSEHLLELKHLVVAMSKLLFQNRPCNENVLIRINAMQALSLIHI